MTRRAAFAVALVGVLGWSGLGLLGVTLYSSTPPNAGFDLEVLLRAGREVASGRSPYDQSILAGAAPVAERLFYSYPPPVAQALSLVAGVPSWLMLMVWDVAAVAGLTLVVMMMARRIAPERPAAPAGLVAIAVTPWLFPLAVGLLFGNLDVFFPLTFGLMALTAIEPAATDRAADRAGRWAGIGLASSVIAKVHPALLGLWFVARALGERKVWRTVGATAFAGSSIVAVSLLAGGTKPWFDYVDLLLVRSGSGADLIDPRNAAPATQLSLMFGGQAGALAIATALQGPISVCAVVATVLAAWRLRDALQGMAIAASASLVVLPVTWYHYPAALIPFGAAALLRARGGVSAPRTMGLVVSAGIVAAFAIAWLPLLMVSVALVIVATHVSRQNST